MTDSNSLRLAPHTASAPRTPEHKRFYTLIGQIEKARQSMSGWQTEILAFRQGYTHLTPLREELLAGLRAWVVALDLLLPQRQWTRSERKTLLRILRQDLETLLGIAPTDELKALYEKHNDEDFESSQRAELEALKEMTEMFTGVDLGDTSQIGSEDELRDHVAEKLAAHEQAQQERRAQRKQRRKSPAQERREQEAQRATQSVREIFRKLASALHPDREPDPQARAAKNELMQKVNRAYEANDLLTLLEVQLQIEQVSAAQIHEVSAERLRHYNKVLGEQLASLKAELVQLRSELEMQFNIELRGTDPRQLGTALEQLKRSLRTNLAQQKRDLRMLNEVGAVKRFLRRVREEMQDEADSNPFL